MGLTHYEVRLRPEPTTDHRLGSRVTCGCGWTEWHPNATDAELSGQNHEGDHFTGGHAVADAIAAAGVRQAECRAEMDEATQAMTDWVRRGGEFHDLGKVEALARITGLSRPTIYRMLAVDGDLPPEVARADIDAVSDRLRGLARRRQGAAAEREEHMDEIRYYAPAARRHGVPVTEIASMARLSRQTIHTMLSEG